MSFPFYKQLDSADCGPTALKIISSFYGRQLPLDYIRDLCYISKDGVSLMGLERAAISLHYNTLKLKLSLKTFLQDAPLPSIIHWDSNHFVVLYKITKKKDGSIKRLYISDPKIGKISFREREFVEHWIGKDETMGIALLLEPMDDFLTWKEEGDSFVSENKQNIKRLLGYFTKYSRYFLQLTFGIIAASGISLIFPFLTQNIVDIGVNNGDLDFIRLMLLAQLAMFLSNTVIDFIRRQLLLHVSIRINLSIITDFLGKLMRLPIRFFDSKNIGDIINRINDQKRIESFITSNVLNTALLFLNFIVLSCVVYIYSKSILVVFFTGTALSILWVLVFMKRRREFDYRMFSLLTTNTEGMYEIVNGMQEIKLNHMEGYKKMQWQKSQIGLFRLNLSSTRLEQYQSIGSTFFTQLKSIVITYISAKSVIHGDISIGMMVSISMIVGQMNAPIEEFISFFRSYQSAKISLERMNEVYHRPDEEKIDALTNLAVRQSKNGSQAKYISFTDVSFRYEGPDSQKVIDGLNMKIPIGKTTAIVGTSGSGKTTLLKLLLKFYEPTEGKIMIEGTDLAALSPDWWRRKCGIVMQEGYIFSDTIERNIIGGEDAPDEAKVKEAAKIACIDSFIEHLPFGYQTKIGKSGINLSVGQKQRIFIARAVYKNPDFFFLDEATSSLDANNEKAIVENLAEVLSNKTAIVIAHRLSTVKNADQILVLENGKVVEYGTHHNLISRQGAYHTLIKNQLELGA